MLGCCDYSTFIIIENKIWYVKWSACSEGESLATRVVGDAWASWSRLSADTPLPKQVFQTISIIITEVSDDASEVAQQLQ